MFNSLQPHGQQHARPPSPSPTPSAYSNSRPSSRWCCPTISSSVISYSSHLQSFAASGFFSNESVLHRGGQSIEVSASTSVLPMNIQDWVPLGWTGWISLQPKGLSRVFPKPHFKGINSLGLACFIVQLSHAYMTTGKTIALTRWTFLGKVMSLLLNMLYRLAFLPRSKHLLISWLQSPSAVIFGAPKTKVSHCFHCLPGVCHDQIPWS